MQYFIDSQDGSLQAAQNCNDKEPFFTVMSTAEFHECKEQLPYYKELLHCLGSIRYCKAEVFKNCIIGTLRLPQKSEQRSPQLSFSFKDGQGKSHELEVSEQFFMEFRQMERRNRNLF